jgi:deoxycytidine triphosphate deaminase
MDIWRFVMILGSEELERRITELFPIQRPYKVGPASVDVRVGENLIQENGLMKELSELYTQEKPYLLHPGQFVLIDMLEYTHVPLDLTAQFILKSTLARQGYNHSLAGLVDPGWNGWLTMEIKNNNESKSLPLYPGMPIGQLVYFQTLGATPYVGRYQDSVNVSGAKEEV